MGGQEGAQLAQTTLVPGAGIVDVDDFTHRYRRGTGYPAMLDGYWVGVDRRSEDGWQRRGRFLGAGQGGLEAPNLAGGIATVSGARVDISRFEQADAVVVGSCTSREGMSESCS